MSPIYGFTLLRNGLKYDYPFRESIASLCGLAEKTVVALGNSEDGTEAELKAFSNLEIVPTVWDEAQRKGGTILSEQTNIALKTARKNFAKGWAFYLQSDECISEQDYEKIKHDLDQAEKQGCDCVSFRYLHFWQSYEKFCIGKRWYPQEIRAIRLDSSIESYGDAQSFRGWKKRFESDAVIYHYGHVREAKAYDQKKKDFHRWWHPDSEISDVIARGEKSDPLEPTLAYYGPHPAVMKERIKNHGGLTPLPRRDIFVYGRERDYSPEFLARVEANLRWTQTAKAIVERKDENTILLRDLPFWPRLFSWGYFKSQVPKKMGSPQARRWKPEFRALLKFSERGVRVN
ncbi:MAG: hypothetical protein ACXWQO_05705 [Bdellovibrionota bacterium]